MQTCDLSLLKKMVTQFFLAKLLHNSNIFGFCVCAISILNGILVDRNCLFYLWDVTFCIASRFSQPCHLSSRRLAKKRKSIISQLLEDTKRLSVQWPCNRNQLIGGTYKVVPPKRYKLVYKPHSLVRYITYKP